MSGLFDEVRAKTRDLEGSLEDLRTAQDRLIQTEKLASLGQLTAGIAHEIKNPLNFVNNFSSLSTELVDELKRSCSSTHRLDAQDTRTRSTNWCSLLKGNLDKVVQHGKRADSIVKNMLLHSREGSSEHRPISINTIVEESLNLAYHGARAEKKDFSITLQRDLDPAAGEVDLYPQEITRVLLNLISNGFYATAKRRMQIRRRLRARAHGFDEGSRRPRRDQNPRQRNGREADDALASAAHSAAADERVQKVCIWTPDKDLAQCVRGDRVVQVDRRTKTIRDAAAVREKFGVEPAFIPDFLALVGDVADGYPGLEGIGRVSAARLIARYGPLERFPREVLGERHQLAQLFKTLATLRSDAQLFDDVEELRWLGPSESFAAYVTRFADTRLLKRSLKAGTS